MTRTSSDSAFADFLAALLNPANRLTVVALGRIRTRHWDQGTRRLDEHMLHYVISGGHRGEVEGTPIVTHPSDLLWLPPRALQDLHKSDGVVFSKFYLRFRLENAERPPDEPWVCPNAPGAYPLFAQFYSEYHSRLPAREERLRALLVLLFAEWRRALSPTAVVCLRAEQRAELLELVDREPKQRLTPRDLARTLRMTPTWFGRVFRNTFAVSPRAWLVQHRVEKSAERIASSDLPISAVAAEYGYDDLFLFSRQFRSVMGVSPRNYRARTRSGVSPV